MSEPTEPVVDVVPDAEDLPDTEDLERATVDDGDDTLGAPSLAAAI